MSHYHVKLFWIVTMCLLSAVTLAENKIKKFGNVVAFTPDTSKVANLINFNQAIPKQFPQAAQAPTSLVDSLLLAQNNALFTVNANRTPSHSAGHYGSGEEDAISLLSDEAALDYTEFNSAASGVTSDAFGTSGLAYTTSRTDGYAGNGTYHYPYRATGILLFNEGSNTFYCSASLIKPGVIVTAAHCVANFGQNQFWSNWVFAPAYKQGKAPFGIATAQAVIVKNTYLNGTDNCDLAGIVCQDDMALIVLNKNLGVKTGWYGLGWDGYGFVNSTAQITQLGYPWDLDQANYQQRTDSLGYVTNQANNTVIGSLQNGGSSGGPWVVNIGSAPKLYGTKFGINETHNIIVGVTSWGFTNDPIKEQGASPFTSQNILPMLNTVCSLYPKAC